MPARGKAAFSSATRFDLLLLSAAALPVLWQCGLITVYRCTHQCGERSNAAFRRQSAAEVTSLAPHDSKARLQAVSTRRDSWRSHVHRTRLRSACSPSSYRLPMCGVKGRRPLRSLGGPRGIFSHVREYPPYPQPHTVWGKAAASSGCSPSAPCAEKERTSLSRSPLFLLIFCCAEAIIPLPASPLRQRQPSPVRRRNTARSAQSASRTSRGTGSWSAGQWRSSSALPRGTRPR